MGGTRRLAGWPGSASWPCLLSLLGAILASGCGAGRVLVDIEVPDIPSEVRSLSFAVRWPQAAGERPRQTVTERLDHFRLVLPGDLSGELRVRVDGIGDGRCALATGEGATVLRPGEGAALVIRLAPRSDGGCQVRADRSGDGAGHLLAWRRDTPDEAPARCDPDCRFPAPLYPGERLRIEAVPAVGSQFLGYSGPCEGTGVCEVGVEAGDLLIGAAFVRGVACEEDGWCWQRPLPSGQTLLDLWGTHEDDLYAVGAAGAVLRWNGSFWLPLPSGTRETLRAIVGLGGDELLVVGHHGTALRLRDGASQPVPVTDAAAAARDLRGAFAAAPGEVFVTDDGGGLLRLGEDGLRLVARSVGQTTAIGGTGPADLWLVGHGGLALHYDGARLVRHETPTTDRLLSVFARAQDDVYAVGGNLPTDAGGQTRVVLHFDGTRWTRLYASAEPPLFDVFGDASVGSEGPWLAGLSGAVLRVSGGALIPVESGAEQATLYALFGLSHDNLAAVGSGGTVLRWNGAFFRGEKVTQGPLVSIAGSGPDNLVAVGDGGTALRFDGQGWLPLYGRRSHSFTGVAPVSDDDIWAVGLGGLLAHWNATGDFRYGIYNRQTNLFAVTGRSASGELWIGAENGIIYAVGGVVKSVFVDGGGAVTSFFDTPDSGLFAAGRGQTIRRWNGAGWDLLYQGGDGDLYGIHGTGPRNVWAVGDRRVVLRSEGGPFRPVNVGVSDGLPFVGVHVAGQDDVWITGRAPASLVHFDGQRGRAYDLGPLQLNGIYGAPGAGLWVVGTDGAILHRPEAR